MNRLDAMSGLISHRLSKTVNNRPSITAMIRGVPIYIGGDDDDKKYQQGGTGILDTGFLANISDAIQQTDADMETLAREVLTAANETHSSELINYYADVIGPLIGDWSKFKYTHTRGWGKFKDNFIIFGGLSTWNSVNQYRQRLLDTRKSAEEFMSFKSPSPAGPSTNQLGKAYDEAKKASEAIWRVIKWVVIIAVVAIGLSVVIYGLPNVTVAAVP